jgi:hypothetical protein
MSIPRGCVRIPPAAFEMLQETKEDPFVSALLVSLEYHSHSQEDSMIIMASAIVHLARISGEFRRYALEISRLSQNPPLLFEGGEKK